jgi:putative SOS response-associated peptidase YedK
MCGRFTKNYTWQQIQALYRLTVPAAIPNMQPSFNVCPTDPVDAVVTHEGNRELVQMRWGLVPYWWNKPLKELRLATFNARIETVTTKPFFREPFKHRRCLMPVSGYYEWQDTPSGKQPWYFTARDGSPLLTAAGLWDQWKNKETGERIKSCTMIISDPNDIVEEVHDRMPILLLPGQFEHWLSGNIGVEELKLMSNNYVQRWAVSKQVNSRRQTRMMPHSESRLSWQRNSCRGHGRLSVTDCRSNRVLEPLAWRNKRKRRQAASVHYCVVPQPRSGPRVYLAAS